MLRNNTQRLLRYLILAAILLLIIVLGRLHSIIKLYPAVDAFCPFGGLESLFTFLKYNAFLKRIALSSMILFAVSVFVTIIFRRSFCGNICPLGFLQELTAKIGRLITGRRFYIPARPDRIMRFLKYIVLVVVIAGTWLTMSLVFRPMDPWAAFHHIGSDELFSGYLIGFIILAVSLAASFFLDRVFCKYLCPMGAFLGILSKTGAFRIRNNRDLCTSCGECDSACSMNISVSETDLVTSAECINCMECTAACPENALTLSTWGGSRSRLNPVLLILITAGIFAAVIGITTLTDDFVWKSPTGLPAKTERLLWGPQRIREDNSFEDISMIFRINPAYILQSFNIDRASFSSRFDEIGIEPDDVELFINDIYDEAGLDPTRIYAGSSCGGH